MKECALLAIIAFVLLSGPTQRQQQLLYVEVEGFVGYKTYFHR